MSKSQQKGRRCEFTKEDIALGDALKQTYSTAKEGYHACRLKMNALDGLPDWDNLSLKQRNEWEKRIKIDPYRLGSSVICPVSIDDVPDEDWIAFVKSVRDEKNRRNPYDMFVDKFPNVNPGLPSDWVDFRENYEAYYQYALDKMNDSVAKFTGSEPGQKYYHPGLDTDKFLRYMYMSNQRDLKSADEAYNAYEHGGILSPDDRIGWERLHPPSKQIAESTKTDSVVVRDQPYDHTPSVTLAIVA